MKYLWNHIDHMNCTPETKYHLCEAAVIIVCGFIGFCVWAVIRNWCLSSIEWMYVFAGYPMLAGWLGVFFYSCRHDFRRKARRLK